MGNHVRALGFAVALLVGVMGTSAADVGAPAAPVVACVPPSQCCMVCDKGQACGNSCISRAKQCHKGRGCSCNASEICPPSP